MIESIEVVTSHLESGENVYSKLWTSARMTQGQRDTDQIEYTPPKPAKFSDHSSRFDINYAQYQVIANGGEEPTIPMQRNGDHR